MGWGVVVLNSMWLINRRRLRTGSKHIPCADLRHCIIELLPIAGLVHVVIEARGGGHHGSLEHEGLRVNWLLHGTSLEIGLDGDCFIFFIARAGFEITVL